MRTLRLGLLIVAAAVAASTVAAAADAVDAADEGDLAISRMIKETDRPGAPVDYGFGPGVRPPAKRATTTATASTAATSTAASLAAAAVIAAPAADPNAQTRGAFGAAFPWPIIPIHVALAPNGKVLSFGSTETGAQGGQYVYAVWDPTRATNGHLVLPNGTGTDTFCAGQSIIPGSGEILLAGGDMTIGNQRNFSTSDANVFNPATNNLRKAPAMRYPRWYPSLVPLPNGDLVVLGGRSDKDPIVGVPTPEVFRQGPGWRTLTTAANDAAYGKTGWYYPRGWQAPNGRVFVLVRTGRMFSLDPTGTGNLQQLAQTTLPGGAEFPSLMYAPGKLLSVRLDRKAVLIDINGAQPVVTNAPDVDAVRFWSNLTVMADGKVLLNGGSPTSNKLPNASMTAQLWDPATNRWSPGATATKQRLYHSVSLLLPDGTVLTGGGGAPGPIRQLNAEIYYPPYLFKKDGSGELAPRPTIEAAPAAVQLGQSFALTVGAGQQISRVTMLRSGTATHVVNLDQRYFQTPSTQAGQTVTVTAPGNINLAIPGWYLVYAFDNAGVPSVARIIRVTA